MVSSYHSQVNMVLILILATAFAFGIAACGKGYPDSDPRFSFPRRNSWRAFIVIGTISSGLALLGLALQEFVLKSRGRTFMYVMNFFWIWLAAVSFIIAAAVISWTYFKDFGVVACVAASIALLILIVQWRNARTADTV